MRNIIGFLGGTLILASAVLPFDANAEALEVQYVIATSTSASSTLPLLDTNQLSIGSLSGVLKAVGGFVTSALVSLTSDVTGVLGVSNGGLGLSTTPSYGEILVGNGSGYMLMSTSSLGLSGIAGPGGTNTAIQFNDGSVFGGDANLTWDAGIRELGVGGNIVLLAGSRRIEVGEQSTSNTPGFDFALKGGDANGESAGGNINITAGHADTSGIGGTVHIMGGTSAGSLQWGGSVEIEGGSAGADPSDGGSVSIAGGMPSELGGKGGNVYIRGGSPTAGDAAGGNVYIAGGSANPGEDGLIIIGNGGSPDGGAILDSSPISGSQVFSFPDASGTFCITTSCSNIVSLGIGTASPVFPLDIFSSGTTTLRIDSDAEEKGSCLVMKDSDGDGYTYITANDGMLTASTEPCN